MDMSHSFKATVQQALGKPVIVAEFAKAVQTLKNWQIEILNSFSYNYSNGGINNLVLEALSVRAKILLTHKYKRLGTHIG
ncbi:hypothetical protein BACCIP111883_04245 [Sutcliffiella rhizosphaerae]|uniref:Transposase IS204/IS1001/IS1096/IS1165 DDE domain-containing protein n=2 Tax=Sutcliffiella rhizosphaerae TaxID=2880967 RepID=A0ABM8YTY5_9BACI|nr:hypothetical protein BACCIP111883_04245 [Sutcliffiella rhizosphaerae]